MVYYIDGLVQENRNSSALAMELRLSCMNHRYKDNPALCLNICQEKYSLLLFCPFRMNTIDKASLFYQQKHKVVEIF